MVFPCLAIRAGHIVGSKSICTALAAVRVNSIQVAPVMQGNVSMCLERFDLTLLAPVNEARVRFASLTWTFDSKNDFFMMKNIQERTLIDPLSENLFSNQGLKKCSSC